MKNKISQYPDLVKYQRKSILIPFVFTGISCAILIGLAISLYINDLIIHHPVFYMILAVIILLPIFIFKPYYCFFDKSYIGKVVDVKCEQETLKSTYKISRLSTIYTRDVLHVKVLTEKCKEEEFSAHNDYLEDSGVYQVTRQFYYDTHIKCDLDGYYNIGDEVEHIKGFDFNRKLNLKHDDKNICIVCGALNLQKDDNCHNCGYSIVK